ncbi:MAG: cytochrome c biogenesis protein CcsA [Thermaurantimonas sp.]
MNLRSDWWKILGVLLVSYTIVMGFLGEVPSLPILNESIRNLYFHVTMWMTMLVMLTVSLVYSIRYLSSLKLNDDVVAMSAAHVGIAVSVIGILTGMLWARHTWGAYWVNDPKLNGAAITLLAYLAYFVLRGAVVDEEKRARISAVYNVFAYVLMILFIQILPRLTDSLHPGNGGNPAFSSYDLDNRMRMVFYPAVIGWSLIGVWILTLKVRLYKLENHLNTLREINNEQFGRKTIKIKK